MHLVLASIHLLCICVLHLKVSFLYFFVLWMTFLFSYSKIHEKNISSFLMMINEFTHNVVLGLDVVMIFHNLLYYLNACFSYRYYFVFENEIFLIKEMQIPTYFGLFLSRILIFFLTLHPSY